MYAPCIVTRVTATRFDKTKIGTFVVKNIDSYTANSIDEVVHDILQMLYANIVYVGGSGLIRFSYDPHDGMVFDIRQYNYQSLTAPLSAQIVKNIHRLEDVRFIIDGNIGRPLQLRVQLTLRVIDAS